MEIKIKNSNLRLVDNYTSCLEKLRFNIGFDTTGGTTPSFGKKTKLFYLVKSNENFGDEFEYTDEEKKIIAIVYKTLLTRSKLGYISLQVPELLCRALEDSILLEDFYGLCNDADINSHIDSFIKYPEASTKPSRIYTLIYNNRKYSVYELLQDLVKDKSEILLTSSLEYTRMSRLMIDSKARPKSVVDSWYKIVRLGKNNTRANLSLQYLGEITIDVPENKSIGFEAETKTLKTIKSMCIIKDGTLWTKEIGVRINSEKLIRKLKGTDLISSTLLHTNEFILDLSKASIIPNSKISRKHCYNSFDFANTELKYELAKVAINYLERKKYMAEKGLTTSPKKLEKPSLTPVESYLAEYGIYGDSYYPKKLVDKSSSFYTINELRTNIHGFPRSSESHVYFYINRMSADPVITDFLDREIKPLEGYISYKDLLGVWNNKLNFYESKLKDLKFKAIVSKKLPKPRNIVYCGSTLQVKWEIKEVKVYV